MGMLVDGKWHDVWYNTKDSGGEFIRSDSQFRSWITPDGSPGPQGQKGFPAESDRYHLYVSYACPWAHRTLILRKLKKLDDVISVNVVSADMLSNGWEFRGPDTETHDELYQSDFMHQIYTRAQPEYSGRVTVPVLWDKREETIVSNESAEIIRMLNDGFGAFTDVAYDFYPPEYRADIDEINECVYHNINNGVYKCGFATTQEAYERNFENLFAALDFVEEKLGRNRYLVGDALTEADIRLFTTLVRFDVVYVGHFKCNRQRIHDFPNLSNYLREIYQFPGVAETVRFDHIKRHYYYSHETVNPTRIVPLGPAIDLTVPHDRDRFGTSAKIS